MTPREPTRLEMALVRELLNFVWSIESLPDDELDPDTAVKMLEDVAGMAGDLDPQDREVLIRAARLLAEIPDGPTAKEVESFLAGFGLVESSGAVDEVAAPWPPPSPPDLGARVAAIQHALREYVGTDRPPSERRGGVPPGELAVIEAALARGGPVAERVLRQFREAVEVSRQVADHGDFELRISVPDALSIRDWPSQGWESGWIPVTAMPSGRPIDISITVRGDGVAGLAGRTKDLRPWPADWVPAPADLSRIREEGPWISMPTPADLLLAPEAATEALGRWLGQPEALQGHAGYVRAEPAASEADIADLEERERFALPPAYRDLLSLTNGITIAGIVLYGTRNAHRLDPRRSDRLVISLPEDEDGALTLAPTGEVVWVRGDDPASSGRVLAPDLRAWFAAQLASADRAGR